MNTLVEKKTQLRANKGLCDRSCRDRVSEHAKMGFALSSEGKIAADKLLDMAQSWRASRWECRRIRR